MSASRWLFAVSFLSLLSLALCASFPYYSDYAGSPFKVSYDVRSIRLNDEPVIFMSGSVHYPRSTPGMWPQLMKNAKADGLNMIEIYVFWNFHEPVEGQFNWADRGNLTLFLDAIAEAGLFANLRIGPYVCAEWDYGGIPTWLAYKPDIRFRSYNDGWRNAVQKWVGEVVAQTRNYWADHGGPIVLAQIENELNGGDPRYVQWSGDMANAMNVNVPWIMCNGQSANNTINACNGNDCSAFIEGNGQNGRVTIDQPALWTENEGWFQSWGDVTYPDNERWSDRTPEDMAVNIARWFARGGSHMNYYMYHGGNHYDRTAAAGLATKYADGVNFHSDGLPNEPKKTHLMKLHLAIAQVSDDLVAHPAQVRSAVPLQWRSDPTQPWSNGTQQVAYEYGNSVFVENMAGVYVQVLYASGSWDLAPNSVLIVQGGQLLYNSSDVQRVPVQRVYTPAWDAPLQWQSWRESPFALSNAGAELETGIPVFKLRRPMEQLNFTRDLTDYCWYSTTVALSQPQSAAELSIDSANGQAFLAWMDGQFLGGCSQPSHDWTSNGWKCTISTGQVSAGSRELSILSIALGIQNGMDPEEIPYRNHWKGVDSYGQVTLGRQNITSGSAAPWLHRPYLTGEYLALYSADGHSAVQWSDEWQQTVGQPLTWYSTSFPMVQLPDSGLYSVLLDLSGMGRGHAYVNGHDIGHYWLILGGDSGRPTQWLYHIPQDWLSTDGDNSLVLLEETGGDPTNINIVISTMQIVQDDKKEDAPVQLQTD